MQDVFLQALQRLPALREPAAFPGWIATIARRRAADSAGIRRMEPMNHETDHDEGPAGHDASPHTRAEAAEVLAMVRRLPEAYRETLVLRLVQGLTGPEIAAVTGLTADSVRVNLHRGLKLLREALGEPA